MADNVTLSAGTADGAVVATDDITSVHYQIVKLIIGALNSGTLLTGNSGTVDAGTVRVVLATDVALPAGTNAIGKLAANSGVDIGDVDVTSVVPGTGATNLGTASGNGLTWVEVASVTTPTPAARSTLFRAMGASPSTGAITISFSTTQRRCGWSVVEFGNVDTSGTNGSGAIVQSVTGNLASGTSLQLNLAAFGNANNATYGGIHEGTHTEAITNGTGFTELHEVTLEALTKIDTQWRADNDTTVDWSWVTAAAASGIAVEIKHSALVRDLIGSGFIPFAR